jgi:hypothetical protein
MAITLGLMFFFYRRRLKVALIVCGVLFAGSTAVRLFIMREEVDRFAELGLGLAVLGGIWLLTNVVTGVLERRRRRRLES